MKTCPWCKKSRDIGKVVGNLHQVCIDENKSRISNGKCGWCGENDINIASGDFCCESCKRSGGIPRNFTGPE